MKVLLRRVWYALWALNAYIGKTVSLDIPQRVTVLMTYYHPARMNHIDLQVRNILKCAFVEKVVVSNHNPDVRIEDKANVRNQRVVYINQPARRACGYRWRVASALNAEYLVVVDDDILLLPSQLKTLFQQLILAPQVPHGFSGVVYVGNDQFEFRQRENIEVQYLCEVYAVTQDHVKRYSEMERLIVERDETLRDTVERYGDFVVISQTGAQNPRIHKVSRLFRADTFKTHGVANHKDEEFDSSMLQVSRAVERIRSQRLAQPVDAGTVATAQLDPGEQPA